jgi:hypothetical protein
MGVALELQDRAGAPDCLEVVVEASPGIEEHIHMLIRIEHGAFGRVQFIGLSDQDPPDPLAQARAKR